MSPWHLPDGYRSQRPVQYIDHPQAVEWQPDVIPFAADLARLAGCTTLIDLGCGFARKLIPVRGLRKVGADLPEVLDFVSHVAGVDWIETNLSDDALPYELLTAASSSVVVCSDVIEHLWDPTPLLHHFHSLIEAGASAVVVSTPDRSRGGDADGNGPPSNGAHAREWSLDELTDLLAEWRFTIGHAGHTRSNDASDLQATSLVVIS